MERAAHLADLDLIICGNCPMCYFNAKMKVLKVMGEKNSMEVET